MSQSLLPFLLEAFGISLSGVLAPGPLTAAAIGTGSHYRYAGPAMAAGHALVETALAAVILLGAGPVFKITGVQACISLLGGLLLLWMGAGVLRGLRTARWEAQASARSPLMSGILLSIGNPYFLLWWATVGMALLVRAAEFGGVGLAAFFTVHWLCDLVWLSVLSGLAFAGTAAFGQRLQQGILTICGIALLLFGLKFTWVSAQIMLF